MDASWCFIVPFDAHVDEPLCVPMGFLVPLGDLVYMCLCVLVDAS